MTNSRLTHLNEQGAAAMVDISDKAVTRRTASACARITINQEALSGLLITAFAAIDAKTGVEMEAITACTIAALTIYDMAKALDRSMTISDIKLLHKEGGRSGKYTTKE